MSSPIFAEVETKIGDDGKVIFILTEEDMKDFLAIAAEREALQKLYELEVEKTGFLLNKYKKVKGESDLKTIIIIGGVIAIGVLIIGRLKR